MKLILSRKGFDARNGGVASPIFPSGDMCSLPIPEPPGSHRQDCYGEIGLAGQPLAAIVSSLTGGKVSPRQPAHVDPDLCPGSKARCPGWRPVFGQAGAAESHLENQGVGVGDIFLFFGWFRRVEWVNGACRYVRGAPDIHALFGWLQVGSRLPVADRSRLPPWALDHPHCRRPPGRGPDCIYLAAGRLRLPDVACDRPGAGVFGRFRPELQLTAPGQSRSIWRLPRWFYPDAGKAPLTYHEDLRRWSRAEDTVLLRSVAIGQEFVLDCDDYPEALGWLSGLLSR